MSRTLSNTKRRPGQHGDFGKETPPITGTTANIHMWLAAWHMDHGHSVADTDQFVDTLRKLDWTATKLRNLSVEKLIEDLHTCDYKFDWAPRLAGDIKRAINLKVSVGYLLYDKALYLAIYYNITHDHITLISNYFVGLQYSLRSQDAF